MHTATFTTLRLAEDALRAAGFSIGTRQDPAPRGLMFGHYLIVKWRNLDDRHKGLLHGLLEYDRRSEAATVTFFDKCPEVPALAVVNAAAAIPMALAEIGGA